jgi:hypothetical protein
MYIHVTVVMRLIMTNQKKEDKPNTTLDKIKKYGPIVATSAAALALGAVTGGAALIAAGIVVAGVLYVQSADALKEELEKSAGPKINRPLQFKEDIKENEQSLNGRDFFKVPENTKLDNKGYLMLGKGENANLYYIDSEGNARKMGLKNADQFKRDVQSLQQLFTYPDKIQPNEHLNQFIQKHVETDKLQTTRQTTKKVVAGIGLAIAIAGVMAALPFVGIPIVGALAICGLGLGIALAAPFVGRMLKKIFNRETEPEPVSASPVSVDKSQNEHNGLNHVKNLDSDKQVAEALHQHAPSTAQYSNKFSGTNNMLSVNQAQAIQPLHDTPAPESQLPHNLNPLAAEFKQKLSAKKGVSAKNNEDQADGEREGERGPQ